MLIKRTEIVGLLFLQYIFSFMISFSYGHPFNAKESKTSKTYSKLKDLLTDRFITDLIMLISQLHRNPNGLFNGLREHSFDLLSSSMLAKL